MGSLYFHRSLLKGITVHKFISVSLLSLAILTTSHAKEKQEIDCANIKNVAQMKKCITKKLDPSVLPSSNSRGDGAVTLELWMADINSSGVVCIDKEESFELWRENAEVDISVTLRHLMTNEVKTLVWPKEEFTLFWPENGWGIPADLSQYEITSYGKSQQWTFRHIPSNANFLKKMALMADLGCIAQASYIYSNEIYKE